MALYGQGRHPVGEDGPDLLAGRLCQVVPHRAARHIGAVSCRLRVVAEELLEGLLVGEVGRGHGDAGTEQVLGDGRESPRIRGSPRAQVHGLHPAHP